MLEVLHRFKHISVFGVAAGALQPNFRGTRGYSSMDAK